MVVAEWATVDKGLQPCAFVVSRPFLLFRPHLRCWGWWLVWWFSGGALGWCVARGGGGKVGFPVVFVFQLGRMGGGAALGSTNSWSDTASCMLSHGNEGAPKVGVSGPAEDLLPVSEVEEVNFRPAGGVQRAGCRFTSQEATRHRYQAGQGKCGHTFPPPGGSWYPIRVTWTWIGHQAIDGLDEGVSNRTVGDLGAKGCRQDSYA